MPQQQNIHTPQLYAWLGVIFLDLRSYLQNNHLPTHRTFSDKIKGILKKGLGQNINEKSSLLHISLKFEALASMIFSPSI